MIAPSASFSREEISALRAIVGEENLIVDPDRLIVYESDGLTAYRHAPRAVILPGSTEEVSAVLRWLAARGLPFVPRGAGTGLSGGALAIGGAVVVGTSRMNRILELDPANRRARVQPGVINAQLTLATQPLGYFYAPDPSSQSACTIGGNVAENSGGPHCLKYGVTSRYVTGLTVVLPDGAVARLGGMGRDEGGLDLVGLFVGSEGCFGIATEIEVGLLPLAEGVRTVLAIFDELEDAGRAVTEIMACGLLPAALEIIDGETIRAVEASVFAAGYPVDAGAALVVEFDGVESGLEDEVAQAEACCREAGARDVRRASTEEERAALWRGRKKAFGAMGRIAPDLLVQDATVPRTKLPEVLREIAKIGARYRLTIANVFHAGDGNLHPNILFDRRDAATLARVEKASKEIMELCVRVGGTITGEHGVGVDKRDYMHLVYSLETLGAMADARHAFDPGERCNPGKVLPDGLPPRKAGLATLEASGSADAHASPTAGGSRRLEGSGEAAESAGPGDSGGARGSGKAGAFQSVEVLLPATEEAVAEVLRRASLEGRRIAPAAGGGEGSDLPGGERVRRSPSRGSGVASARGFAVLKSTCLSGIIEYEPANLTLTAGAGTTMEEIRERTAEQGQWLPLDPPGVEGATLGDVLADGCSGPLSTGFGGPRDHVLGLRAVTGDGRIVQPGGRVVKNVAGFDLVRLLTGSRERLGIITAATVRLHPLPAVDETLLFRCTTSGDAVRLAERLAATPVPLAALEVLLPPSRKRGDAEGGPLVAVRLLGSRRVLDETVRRLRERVDGRETSRLEGSASGAFFTGMSRMESGGAPVIGFSFLPGRLAEVIGLIKDVPGGGRASDSAAGGNLPGPYAIAARPMRGELRLLLSTDDGSDLLPSFLEEVLARTRSAGVSSRVIRGPEALFGAFEGMRGKGAEAAAADRDDRGRVAEEIRERIKKAFDPAGVLP